jgi:hypothetical protein
MFTNYGELLDYSYVDLKENPVKKTREEYPYSYDAYVIWKKDYKEGKGNVVYSDRLMQWDFGKYNACCKRVWNDERQYFDDRQPEDIEMFLSLYFEKTIKLTAIMKGCNVSNGYPYWVFFYEDQIN